MNYPGLFGFQIYDGYRPTNLAQTKDYLEFLTKKSSILSEDISSRHILDYLRKDLETVLPESINEKNVLSFDQNFECGNLDSAYVKTCEDYNLLMKVDANTRGNTYWFMFKVTNFKVG